MFAGTHGNVTEMYDLFGKRGAAVGSELKEAYKANGVAGVTSAMQDVMGASMSSDQLDKMFEETMSTPAEKFAVAVEKIRSALADKLTPFVEKAANSVGEWEPQIERAIGAVASVADFFVKNPFLGLGAIVAASITKEIAAAQIGELIKRLLTGGGGGGGGGGMPFVGSAAALMAAAGAGAAVGFQDISSHIDLFDKHRDYATKLSNAGVADASILSRKAKEGTVTAADFAAAQAELTGLKSAAATAKGRIGTNEMGMLQTGISYVTGHGGELREAQTRDQAGQYKQLQMAVDAFARSLQSAAAVTTATNTSPTNPANSLPIDQRPTH
jgi:hypothetical protein